MRSCIFFRNKQFSYWYNVIKISFIGGDKIKCFWFGKIKLGKAKLSNSNKNMQYSIIKSVIKTSYIKENGIAKVSIMLHWRPFRSETCMKLSTITNKNIFPVGLLVMLGSHLWDWLILIRLTCSHLKLVPTYGINLFLCDQI